MEHKSKDLRFAKRFLLAYDDKMSSSVMDPKAVKTIQPIRTPKSKYTVRKGDTLTLLSAADTTFSFLYWQNSLKKTNLISFCVPLKNPTFSCIVS